MKRNDVIQLMHDMPEEVDTEELMYRLYLRQKLERAEAEAEAGDVISHEELERQSEEWLK